MSLVEWWAESDIGRAAEKFAALIDLNGREAAILIWLAAVLLFCLVKRDIRGSLWGVVCAFIQWKILQWVAFMAIYTAGWVAVLAKLGLWGTSNLKTTVVWVLTFALVTMMEAAKLTEDKKSFGKLLREIVAPTVFVVFVAELHTFNVWAELMLLPVLALISGMLALAESRREHAIIVKPLTSLQAIIGVSFLIFSAYHIISDFKAFATLDTLREFIVPIVLSLLFLPFLYAMAIFMAYESAFTGLSFRIEDRRLLGYAKRRAVFAFGLNLDYFRRWTRNIRLNDVTGRDHVKRSIRELRAIRKREKNPPVVPPSSGWSPYVAIEFLTAQGLQAGDYHRSFTEWFAESPSLKFGDHFMRDWITYYVEGHELAATRLKLTLNANRPGDEPAADTRFFAIARELVDRAFDQESVDGIMQRLASADTVTFSIDQATIRLTRDDWGKPERGGYNRRLVIVHGADRGDDPV